MTGRARAVLVLIAACASACDEPPAGSTALTTTAPALLEGAPAPVSRPRALLVVTAPGHAPIPELRERLKSLGYDVDVRPASGLRPVDVAGAAVVIVGADCAAGVLRPVLAEAPVPIVVLAPGVLDELGMGGARPGKDTGWARRARQLDVVAPLHPMAAGLSGRVSILDGDARVGWAVPAPGATVVATAPGEATHPTVFAIAGGQPLAHGRAAPAARVAWLLVGAAGARPNTRGWALFDAALCWATGQVRRALLVTGGVGAAPADRDARNRLERLGFVVDVRPAARSADALARADLVVLSRSCGRAPLDPALVASPVPVIALGAEALPAIGMTGAAAGTDFGMLRGQRAVRIVATGHALAAGLTGTVNVSRSPETFGWGKPAQAAVRAAEVDGRAVIFAYDTGTAMTGGPAPGPRVAWLIGVDALERSTAAGGRLFDATARWAVDARTRRSCHGKPDGAPCSDGLACNGVEVCRAGACVAGPLACPHATPLSAAERRDLRLFPPDIAALLGIAGPRVASASPGWRAVIGAIGEGEVDIQEGLADMRDRCGLDVTTDVSSLIVGWPQPLLSALDPRRFLAVLRGSFRQDALTTCLRETYGGAPAPTSTHGGQVIYGGDDRPFFTFVDGAMVFGSEDDVRGAIDRARGSGATADGGRDGGSGGDAELLPALECADRAADIWAVGTPIPSTAQVVSWPAGTRAVTVAARLSSGLSYAVEVHTGSVREALAVEEQVRDAIPRGAPLGGWLEFLLRAARVDTRGATARLAALIDDAQVSRFAAFVSGTDGCANTVVQATKEYAPVVFSDGERQLTEARSFALPAALDVVAGAPDAGRATFSFRDPADRLFTCTYRARAGADRYTLDRCVPRVAAGELVRATWVKLHLDDGDATAGTTAARIGLFCP